MMWTTLLLRHWYWIAIASLALALSLSMLHSRAVTAERNAARVELQSVKDAAQLYQEQSTQNAKVINDAIPVMLKQAEANAWRNWQKKFGTNVACGIRTNGLLPRVEDSPGQADSAPRTDELSEQEFVAACASDAGITEQWKAWARLNSLDVTQ